MVFTTFSFLIFFPVVCLVYFLLPAAGRWRNIFLLIASYYFYMNWEPVYALLIFGSTLVTYLCGIYVDRFRDNKVKAKGILVASLLINFGILFVFKYYNFINESVFQLLDTAGIRWPIPNFELLLPVGISFYTFQAVGYSIDVYRGDIKPERDLATYALFVSFFPQLVAGPIERAKNLLPQFYRRNTFQSERAIAGLKLMLWGYFMKLCVADRVSQYVDAVYNNLPEHSGSSVALATILFAFQIYCDFCGYSLIAIGAARVMGFDLMENFRRPYFSVSVKEFWRRWHISLSTWFMDYVYIPLGGNRVPYGRHLLNLFITFFVSGIWHGANWTFVLWGSLNGFYLICNNIWTRKLNLKILPDKGISRFIKIINCFIFVNFAWIFFRANNAADAFTAIGKVFTDIGGGLFIDKTVLAIGGFSILLLILKESIDEFGLKLRLVNSKYPVVAYLSVITLICYILLFGVLEGSQFIYFQF